LSAENEFETNHNIHISNHIIKKTTLVAKEITTANFRELLNQARIEARREAAIAIILKQLCYKMDDYSLIFHGLPAFLQTCVDSLSLEQLENLSIEALQMASLDDLRAYFSGRCTITG